MLYRFLVDNANQIHSLLSNADAEADVSSERARDYRITAAFLACDTFNRLLYESVFQKSLEECRFWYRDYYDSNMKALDPYDADNLDMLYIFLRAERRLLTVAGMNEGAASYLLDDDNVIPILSNASLDREQGPLARERVENAGGAGGIGDVDGQSGSLGLGGDGGPLSGGGGGVCLFGGGGGGSTKECGDLACGDFSSGAGGGGGGSNLVPPGGSAAVDDSGDPSIVISYKAGGVGEPPPPTEQPQTKEDCKNGGYEEFGFKNQGQCIKAVNHPS
jgi:hypothetical protein